MTDDDKQYFESQMDMFASIGWKHFASQLEQMRQATDRLSGVAEEDVRFKQGELSIIAWALAWPKMIETEYNDRLAAETEQHADV